MLKRHWGIFAAIALTVLVVDCLAWTLVSTTQSKQIRYENTAKNNADNYAYRRDVIIGDRCNKIAAEDKKAACINEEREAARKGKNDERDLEAQLTTAAWTASMGIAAIVGMAASLIGVILVFITFAETRKANDIAVRAEDASLIFNFPEGLEDPVGDFLFEMTIANVGRSAAIIHEVDICGEKVLMERTIKAGETAFLGKFAIVPAIADKNLILEVRYSTPFKTQEIFTERFRVLPPRGDRKTWWAFSFKFKKIT
jgi:hypothetical protein